MYILKVYNNNLALSQDSHGNEIIVMGCGIAFQKKAGERVDESKVEKVFTLHDKTMLPRLEMLINEIPPIYLEITEKIVDFAKSELNLTLNDNIYLTLTDHISFAVKRIQEGLFLSNPMAWDIKCFYKNEYQAGLKALEIIRDMLHIDVPEDEAAFITLHVVDASMNLDHNKGYNLTKIIGDILSIIKGHISTELDEDSTNYYRLVTHLKLFLQRLTVSEDKDDSDDFLFESVKRNYPETYECARKIKEYVQQKFGQKVTDEEMGYLMIHIRKIMDKQSMYKS